MAPVSEQTSSVDLFSSTPEERLLVLCSRLELNLVQLNELEALVSGPLRWDWILHKARWHLFPLLFRHLQRLENKGSIPSEVMDWLKTAYITSAGRSLYFDSEMRRILEELNAREIPVIVLKGAVLADKIYGSRSVRPMTDIDLLVHHQDADTADTIVRGMGYKPSVREDIQEEMRDRDRQLARLATEGRPVIFDIHSHIVDRDNPLRFDIAGFWDRAVPTTMAGVPTLMLAPEDFLIHLGVNFFKDLRFNNFSALGELCDISEVIKSQKDSIDWGLLVSTTTTYGLTGPIFCALWLAQYVVGAPIPSAVLEQLKPVDFDPKDARRLVDQRVLGENWVAKALVEPNASYSWRTLTRGMLRRIFPSRRNLADHYDVPELSTGIGYYYFRRLGEAALLAIKLLTNPRQARNDLAVDRWLHSLYGARGK